MRLTRVEIQDYRSVFADDRQTPLVLELATGMNTLVGPNNCGKSNVLRAIALALDPQYPFDAAIDTPAPRRFAYPIVTLHFDAHPERAADKSVLEAAKAYEASVGGKAGYTTDGRVVLNVAYEPSESGQRRREVLLTPGGAVPGQPDQFDLLADALARLREAVRFVLISSGESIRSVLDGNFREILHSVVRERLAEAFADAEAARAAYVSGLEESLLAPLRDRLVEDIHGLFPEVGGATLVPDVLPIEQTLARVNVGLEDLVATPLSEKGTGLRGGVLVAMLSYLATNATRGMIFALEEPEAFLHPEAQEDLRDRLEVIAGLDDVSLLVTTHSPHIVTRVREGRIFGIGKDSAGRTRVGEVSRGDEDHGPIISALHRDSPADQILKQSASIPPDARALVFVEGDGDKLSIELAADLVGRPDLLDGLVVRAAAGASKTVVPAVIARANIAPRPVIVVLDNDEPGRKARERLLSQGIEFTRSHVFTYAAMFPQNCANAPIEAEDLYEERLWEDFVELHGKDVLAEWVKRPDGGHHYGFDQAAKELLEDYVKSNARPGDVRRWIELILRLRSLAGMDDYPLTVDEIIAAAPERVAVEPMVGGDALVVTDKLAYSRYQRQGVLILETAASVSDHVTHVGFYADGEIKAEFPLVVRRYPSVRFGSDTIGQLRGTGTAEDKRVADVIERSLQIDDDLAGTTQQLLLLSPFDSEETVRLERPIKNTKQKAGRPLAWAIKPTNVPMSTIRTQPATTAELDAALGDDA